MSKINDIIQESCPNGVEYKKLSDLVTVNRGSRLTKSQLLDDGIYEVYHGSKDIPLGKYDKYNTTGDTVIVVNTGGIGGVKYLKNNFWCSDGSFNLGHNEKMNNKFLYYFLSQYEEYFTSQKRVGGVPTIDRNVVENVKIPVPPLEVQEEIVKILDKFGELESELERELSMRKIQYEFFRSNLLNNYKCALIKVDDIANNVFSGKCNIRNEYGKYPVYGSTGIIARTDEYLYDTEKILVARVGANAGYVHIAKGKYNVTDNTLILDLKENIDLKFMYYYLQNYNLNKLAKGGGQPLITSKQIKNLEICLPPLEEQKRISNILDKFDKLINDITDGLPAEIELRKRQYEYYRNKLLSFEVIDEKV